MILSLSLSMIGTMMGTTLLLLLLLLFFVFFVFFPFLATTKTDDVANTRSNQEEEKRSFIVAPENTFILTKIVVGLFTNHTYQY